MRASNGIAPLLAGICDAGFPNGFEKPLETIENSHVCCGGIRGSNRWLFLTQVALTVALESKAGTSELLGYL